ncbi:MAG: peptide chain release factor 1 [Bacilli bacterium]|nr:peptide chain release factor 1 [Bacilli bacterium]
MEERLNIIEQRYDELEKELSSEEVLSDYNKMSKLNKEKSDIEETVIKYREYKKLIEDVDGLKEMLNDPEMKDIAEAELEENNKRQEELKHQLELLLVPKDENDGKDIIVEIRGAAGGDEANIFAGDLFRMYQHYADKNGWKTEILDANEGEAGGYSQIEFSIKGNNVYSKMKYESGAHRVQRIPVTESNGRIQTSTATVAVMPEAEEVDYELNMDEIRVDITRASGNGGQGVNTTDSAVRLTHIPTGIIVYQQTERSQIRNKEKAMEIMRARLYDLKLREAQEKEGNLRRSQIGTGDRSEKIRTYNYPQNRVTDHRINFSVMNLEKVMNGDLDPIIDELITEDTKRKLQAEQEG